VTGSLWRILRNSAGLVAVRVLTKLATTLLMILVARLLGEEEFGVLSSILAYAAMFGVVQEMGLTVPMIRRIAFRDRDPGVLVGEVLGLKLFLSLPALAGFFLVAGWMGVQVSVTALFTAAMVLEVLNVSLARSFEGVERVNDIAIVLITERVTLLAGGTFAVAGGWGLTGLGVAFVAAYLLSFFTAIQVWRRRHSPVVMVISWGRAKVLLREALPFVGAAVFSIIYTRIDVILLTAWRSSAEVGLYTAAFRVTEAELFIPTAIVAAMFPALTRTFSEDFRSFMILLRRSAVVVALVGVTIAGATWFAADIVIDLLYGRAYAPAGGALRILSWMVPLYYVNHLAGSALIAMGREHYSTLTLAVGALGGTVLNFLLIRTYGQLGSASARVLTEILCFLIQTGFLLLFLRSRRRAAVAS